MTLLASNDGWASAHITAVATPPELDGPTGAALRWRSVGGQPRYPVCLPTSLRRRASGHSASSRWR
ncbi:hypothetical protein M8494_13675 [Serratia ureilytica]